MLPLAHARRVIIVHNCTHRVVVTFPTGGPFYLMICRAWQRPRGGGSGREERRKRERTDRSEERQIRYTLRWHVSGATSSVCACFGVITSIAGHHMHSYHYHHHHSYCLHIAFFKVNPFLTEVIHVYQI